MNSPPSDGTKHSQIAEPIIQQRSQTAFKTACKAFKVPASTHVSDKPSPTLMDPFGSRVESFAPDKPPENRSGRGRASAAAAKAAGDDE